MLDFASLDFAWFGAYLGAVITLIITPGPVVALVLKNTLKGQDSKSKSTSLKNNLRDKSRLTPAYRCKHCGDFGRG